MKGLRVHTRQWQRRLTAIGFWMRHPSLLVPRIQYWVWEKLNPDKPWLCQGTMTFCQANLSRSMKALEFGSGRSTRWFAGLVGHLTSVEHDSAWFGQVHHQLNDVQINNVDYRFVPLNHAESEPERSEYRPPPDYVAVADGFPDRSLHLVIVDGHYRTHCVRHSVPKLAAGGFLLVDDVNMWPSLDVIPVPASWPVVNDCTNGVKRCVIWQAV